MNKQKLNRMAKYEFKNQSDFNIQNTDKLKEKLHLLLDFLSHMQNPKSFWHHLDQTFDALSFKDKLCLSRKCDLIQKHILNLCELQNFFFNWMQRKNKKNLLLTLQHQQKPAIMIQKSGKANLLKKFCSKAYISYKCF